MACLVCKVDKLANEFPPYNGSNDCDHPSLTCLRCLVKYVDKHESCPHPDCKTKISKTSATIQLFKAILANHFKVYETVYTPRVDVGTTGENIYITDLTGESISIPYTPYTTIQKVKLQIQEKMKHEKEKQKLLYESKELSIYRLDGEFATLADYSVKPNATLCLVVCLLSIPDDFDGVIFDLYWGYPSGRRDYLDASCLIFKGTTFVQVVDYCNGCKMPDHKAIRHSGDVMDDKNKIGHHTIYVSMKKIPLDVTHLFFTLSAWSSPNISHFPNPSLKFYDAKEPDYDLCKTTFTHASNSQAVIMCSVSKDSKGAWKIFESGQLSAGNAENYKPLMSTARQLIKRGI